jgi:hypothetical protein
VNQAKKIKKFGKGIYFKKATLRDNIGIQTKETPRGLFKLGYIRKVSRSSSADRKPLEACPQSSLRFDFTQGEISGSA